ncbi:MAG: hypothetical protein K9H84_00835, partial [Bacteroidales bacterium]|nr:hypothetical protein [Bacteroidales bacterium]
MNQNQSKTSHRGFIAFTIFQKTAHYIFLFLFTLFFKNYINYNIEDSYHYFGIFLYLIPIASITGGFISDYTNRTLIFHIGIWLAIIGLSIILFSGSGISLTVFVVSSFVMAIGLGFIHVMIITLIGINSEIRKTEKQNYIDLAWYFLAITSASFLVNILSQSGAFKEPAFKATALKIAVVSLLTGYIIWLIRNIKRNPFADVRPETKYKPAKPVLILFLVFIFISLMKISANQILSVHLSFNFHHTVHWNYDGTALIKLIITLIITIILSKRNGLNTNMIYRIFRSLFIIFPVLFTG